MNKSDICDSPFPPLAKQLACELLRIACSHYRNPKSRPRTALRQAATSRSLETTPKPMPSDAASLANKSSPRIFLNIGYNPSSTAEFPS
ncbi:hypothetical protein HYQ45_006570 [Verticillium longisporum]|uniref:Uncharacterized protein n=1 Tax=Verticillium longisporum TaxID=100787 RepID=A0A8I2ZR31_VERLO|nr:hypothetical protein HYQ45_006570 [Verticillium longisporum]